MKTRIYLIMIAAAFAISALLASCSGDSSDYVDSITEPNTQQKTYTLTVNASKEMNNTRALSLDGTTLNATWAMGDVVKVYNSENILLGTLTAQGSGSSTTLSGEITATDLSVNDLLTLKFLSDNYNSQDGTIEGIAANCDYATATITITAIDGSKATTSNASFENQQAICKFTLNQSVAKLLILTPSSHNHIISVTPASATDVLYLAMPATGEKTAYTFIGTTSEGVTYTGTKKANLINGNYYATAVTMTEEMRVVDLGLSVKWATMNVGASSVEGYGSFFAWGETTGYSSSDATDHSFEWANYSLCGGSSTTLTKYNYYSDHGTVDNVYILELADDAAYVNWGSAWRMPTHAEMQELARNTDYVWTENYNDTGINGIVVTSRVAGYTDKFIFFPCAGSRYGLSLLNQGSIGNYWMSTLQETYPDHGWLALAAYYGLNSDYPNVDRCSGQSVRAVLRN